MNALAIHLYLTIRHINLSFNYFGNFYRIIVYLQARLFLNVPYTNYSTCIKRCTYEKDNIDFYSRGNGNMYGAF